MPCQLFCSLHRGLIPTYLFFFILTCDIFSPSDTGVLYLQETGRFSRGVASVKITKIPPPPGLGLLIMDADSNDGTASEVLNGDTKPDPAKLAQSAIIKQVGANPLRHLGAQVSRPVPGYRPCPFPAHLTLIH